MIFLSDAQLAKRWDVDRSTVWRWRRRDVTFPPTVTLGENTIRFRLSDVEAWEAAKAKPANPATAA